MADYERLTDNGGIDSHTIRTVVAIFAVVALVTIKWLITREVQSDTLYMAMVVISALAGIEIALRK